VTEEVQPIKEKEIQIFKTEFVDKGELPTIYYKRKKVKSMTEWEEDVIQVSGKSSEEAYDVFNKIKGEEK